MFCFDLLMAVCAKNYFACISVLYKFLLVTFKCRQDSDRLIAVNLPLSGSGNVDIQAFKNIICFIDYFSFY